MKGKRKSAAQAAHQKRFASCAKSCKGRGKGFRSCVRACVKK